MHAPPKRLMCVASTMYVHGLNLCTVELLSNPDTNGAEESVIVSEVSSFQRLSKRGTWGGKRCPV